MSRARDLGDVGSKANFLDTVSTDLGDFSGQSIPHIIPDVLYPAVEGKDLAGVAFSGSYVYGTAHTDNRKYYYTDIKGSKPIKDPRIGGHFGSQRHTLDSLQLLEQETATHGKNVYTVDGREWIRVVGADSENSNNSYGNYIVNYELIEVVGYFNSMNIGAFTQSGRNPVTFYIDGSADGSETDFFETSVVLPTGTRFVDSAGYQKVPLTAITTPGIHTFKMVGNPKVNSHQYGIELIAQDTTSTANRSKIQIPSQDVVSYGKKFNVSGTPHYDPFNGFVDDTTLFSAKVDTATSLGLGTATTWGASWDTGSNNHIRPFNGGRVIKWADSSGTIKTSVTMMPRNAQNITTTNLNEITDVSSTNSHTINFSDDAVEHSLSEVAKTFHFREFGNGNANGGYLGTYKDASMVDSADSRDIAFVMDDGLTSLAGNGVNWVNGLKLNASTANIYITFIGTGISLKFDTSTNSGVFGGTDHYEIHIDGVEIEDYTSGDSVSGNLDVYVQNLPYGSHILRLERIAANTTGLELLEVAFHQPKKPPIPEDACVLADYMLMADYVAIGDAEDNLISKGVRRVHNSRDFFYDNVGGSNAVTLSQNTTALNFGFRMTCSDSYTSTLPYFGTQLIIYASHSDDETGGGGRTTTLNGTHLTSASGNIVQLDNSASAIRDATKVAQAQTLGVNTVVQKMRSGDYFFHGMDIATPIHTSFHYTDGNKTNPKTGFETPFLNELVGGDRNLEQHTLVCSPDGKTWDEVTRDTSYIGLEMLCADDETSYTDSTGMVKFDVWRGTINNNNMGNKNFAIAYDRQICLRDGMYEITASTIKNINTTFHVNILVNGVRRKLGHSTNINHDTITNIITIHLKRGDYVQIEGGWRYTDYSHFQITRVG